MTETAAAAAAPHAPAHSPPQPSPAKAIFLASIGNALEWFDLIVFGFLSVVISHQFFPPGNETAALLLTFVTFGLAFIIRPVGAVVLGAYADTAGRMKAMVLTIGIMMLGTAIIAFIPTYAQIGLFATVGLVVARLLQGFSAGGEFGSATAFLAEQNPARRGFFASWQVASQGLTTLLASGFGAVLAAQLTPEQLSGWGWRIPFIFGLIIGPVALYIRRAVPETEEFKAIEPTKTPIRDVFASQKAQLVTAIGVTVLGNVATYLVLFMPTFAVRELGLPAAGAFTATLLTGTVQLVLAPVAGWVSDRIGRVPVMACSAVGMLVLIWPLFAWLTSSPTVPTMLAVQVIFGVLLTGYFATVPALLCDLFPTRTRTTGLSLGYNIAATLFGGFAPALISWLILATGSKLAPSYYVMFGATLSLCALIAVRKKFGIR
jgi:MHS family proline/betaine transporter-like MFS transporter